MLVQVGQRVSASDIVARTQLPGNVQAVNVANLLGVLPEDVEEFLTKPVGSHVEKGEVFAESKSFFGLFRSKCHAPVQGSIESVSKVTGQVLLREEPIPVEVDAYVDGTIVEVHPRSGVTVETRGAFIQGIFGVGGETCGELRVSVSGPEAPLEERAFDASSRGKVIVGGAYVTTAVLRKAIAQGVKAVVVGGFDRRDFAVEFTGVGVCRPHADRPLNILWHLVLAN